MTEETPTPPTSPQGGFDMNQPTIISLLYLASFLTGISGLVGIVLAYLWRDEAQDWAQSHFTYLIRTFWLGLVGSIISFVLIFVVIGIFTLIAVAVWFAVRCILSLINAQKRAPMPDPETLWV